MSNLAMAQMEKAEIIATGLTCSMCSKAIYKQLLKIPEVEKVDTNLEANSFMIYLKKDNHIKPNVLKNKVEEAGFFVGSLIAFLPTNTLVANGFNKLNQENVTFEVLEGSFIKNSISTKVKILDKGFVTSKEYNTDLKSINKLLQKEIQGQEVYHVKIIQ